MIVIFVGIAVFTLITGEVLFYRKSPSIEDSVKGKHEEVTEFLFQLS